MTKLPSHEARERLARSLLASIEPFRSRALLLLRGYAGAVVLLAHGLPKLRELVAGDRHLVALVAGMGLPAPELFAWLSALTQVLGSTALIAGAATRAAALGVATTIAIGMLGVHLGDPFQIVEAGIAYVVMLAAIAILGPGDLSVDRVVRDRLIARVGAKPRMPGGPMIHVAITRQVRAGREHEFEDALRRFFREALDEPSTSGASLILPVPGSGSNEYGVLRSFPNEAAKEAFYRSETYRRWQREVAPLVEGEARKHELHGLEAFFRTDAIAQPPAWKMAVLTWLAVNPAVWIGSRVVPGALGPMPPLLELLAVNAFVVATLTWAFMPVLVRAFGPWLR